MEISSSKIFFLGAPVKYISERSRIESVYFTLWKKIERLNATAWVDL